jgi:hypothetical protein
MPTVRRAEQTVDVSALPRARKSAARTAESEGAGTALAQGRAQAAGHLTTATKHEGLSKVGDQVTRMGVAMFRDLQEKEREKAHKTALLAASNKLSDWQNARLFDPKTGAFTKKGEAALTLPEDIRTEFDKVAGDIEASLSTDEQRLAFANVRSQEWQSVDLQVRRHTFGEMQTYRQGELAAHITNTSDAAIRSANDPKLVQVELHKAVTAIRTNGPGMGLGPEQVDAQVKAVQSKVHVGVIGNLLASDQDQAATAYFEATKGQIGGEHLDGVTKALEEGGLRSESQKLADTIGREGGTLAQQRAKAAAITNAKLRDAVEQRIEHNAVIREREQREAEEASQRSGYDLIDQTHDVTKIPAAQWASYDGATRSAMIHYATLRAKGAPIETDDPSYYRLMQTAADDPAAFASTNLMAYRPYLDDGDFKQIVNLQLAIKKGDRAKADVDLAGFRTKGEILENTLTQYGINPKAKPESAEGKAIAQLQRMLDRRVEAAQQRGQKVTNVEIQQTLDGLLSQGVDLPGSWWNAWPGGRPGPWGSERKRLIDLSISDVPPATRKDIEQRMRARGRPVTDATVLETYLQMQIK